MDPLKILFLLLVLFAGVAWLVSRHYAKKKDNAKMGFIYMQVSFVFQLVAVIVFFYTI
ncbi:hypothetical protein [Piscibacillus halophilus]|uniref:Uncharacterized protein n=1 Tax=Piscibacillus halophilus TaxID=571933 RepID=A0A1H9HTJ4_9BACI|nr:hypothetical protein [Piscibacillus halophilus]SEQ65572.1 hypothetical protein SAMN05216362_1218 [Piscibacillus halophilus]